jgi:hypothetical protein
MPTIDITAITSEPKGGSDLPTMLFCVDWRFIDVYSSGRGKAVSNCG